MLDDIICRIMDVLCSDMTVKYLCVVTTNILFLLQSSLKGSLKDKRVKKIVGFWENDFMEILGIEKHVTMIVPIGSTTQACQDLIFLVDLG
jgi:hypothetical protein